MKIFHQHPASAPPELWGSEKRRLIDNPLEIEVSTSFSGENRDSKMMQEEDKMSLSSQTNPKDEENVHQMNSYRGMDLNVDNSPIIGGR